MRSSRFRPALLFGLAALCLAVSCAPKAKPTANDGSTEPPGRLTQIVESGELTIGTSGEQPPLTMLARNGELIGLDVALAHVLATSMKLTPRFVKLPFSELLSALESGQVDLVMSGVTITPERQTRFEFAGPYYTSGKTLLTKSRTLASIDQVEALDAAAPRVVALAGSTSETFVDLSLPRATLVSVQHLEEAIAKLIGGEADAMVADAETCAYAVLKFPDEGLMASEARFTLEPMGIAVARDNPRLANLVGTYLDAIEEHGILDKAKAFWFKDSSWVDSVR